MFGITCYLALSTLCAVAVFLFAEWIREPGVRAPDHPGRIAVVTGLLWPVVLIGMAQCAVLVASGHKRAAGRRRAPRISVGSAVESP